MDRARLDRGRSQSVEKQNPVEIRRSSLVYDDSECVCAPAGAHCSRLCRVGFGVAVAGVQHAGLGQRVDCLWFMTVPGSALGAAAASRSRAGSRHRITRPAVGHRSCALRRRRYERAYGLIQALRAHTQTALDICRKWQRLLDKRLAAWKRARPEPGWRTPSSSPQLLDGFRHYQRLVERQIKSMVEERGSLKAVVAKLSADVSELDDSEIVVNDKYDWFIIQENDPPGSKSAKAASVRLANEVAQEVERCVERHVSSREVVERRLSGGGGAAASTSSPLPEWELDVDAEMLAYMARWGDKERAPWLPQE